MTSVVLSVAELAELIGLIGRVGRGGGPGSGRPPVLLDVRWRLGGPPGPDEFRAGHLPGAVYVDLDTELAGPAGPGIGRHPLPSPDVLQAAARRWGLDDGDAVVVYDDLGNLSAARAWWLLRWAGIGDVRLLDGGLAAWRAAGHDVVTGDEAPPAPGNVTLRPGLLPTLEPDDITGFVDGGALLLDARTGERYRGEPNPIDPQFGHIPGALSAPTVENLTPEGTFRPATELAERFRALGAEAGRPVGVYCGSGVTAAHEIAALAIAGIDDVVLYPGSWSQWATQPGRPVATGDPAGTPASTGAPLVSARDARERVAGGAVLLDTRSPEGRELTGVIPGAVVVDRDNLDAEFDLASADRHQEVTSLDTPIVVVCGSVDGSGPVAEALIARGFVNVVHVEGGAPAWHEKHETTP
jgi:thiosulfate/3-mercaptopyruvate sulfurtransferase